MTIQNIAFIHSEYPCGGAEKITAHISLALAQRGYHCFLFVHTLYREKLPSANDSLHFLPLGESNVHSSQCADSVIRQIRDKQIDLFVCPQLYLDYLDRIRKETSCKVLYCNHALPFWEIACKKSVAAHNSKKSVGKWLEWHLFRAPKYNLPHYLMNKIRNSYQKVYDQCDAYSVLCPEYGDMIERELKIQPSDSKLVVLTNPTMPLAEPVNLNKKKQVVYIGRMTFADKRVDRVLKVWKQVFANHRDWELLIYGDGEEEQNLRALAQKLKLENCRFMGYCKNPVSVYQQASILCLTSTVEGWGLVLTEAQQYGVFPVAFDCSAGVHEILSPSGENGFLVSPFDITAYAEQLQQIMTQFHDRTDMRQHILQSVSRFSVERTVEQWLHVIHRLEQ